MCSTLGYALDAGWRVKAKCEGAIYIEKKLFGGCTERTELDIRRSYGRAAGPFPARSFPSA